MMMMMGRGRGRRGSGRRRLNELTRSVVDTQEILEDVRGKHPGVGGMSKALVQVVKLYFQTCSTDGEEKGTSGGGSYPPSSFKSFGGSGYSPSPATASAPSPRKPPSKSKTGLVSSSSVTGGNDPSSTASNVPGSGLCSGMGVSAMGTRGSNSVFLEGGAAAGGGTSTGAEEALPMGVASVLWELECCVGQARITLMNLIEGRPNHFGVFRAGVYVEEIRMLEAKILELVRQAVDPPEEKNASLETTVASGIRNCVARLWWSRRAGDNAETMTWQEFQETFQEDFGEQLPKTLDVLRKNIAVRGDAPGAGAVGANAVSSLVARSASSASPYADNETRLGLASPRSRESASDGEVRAGKKGSTDTTPDGVSWAAAAAAIEATPEASVAQLTASTSSSAAATGASAAGAGATAAPGGGVTGSQGGVQGFGGSSWDELMRDVDTARGTRTFGRGLSRLLSSVRREWEGSWPRSTDSHTNGGDSSGGYSDTREGEGGGAGDAHASSGDDDSNACGGGSEATWRVTAAKYEEVTWTHGGLYEAFQALADPRRVVFSMGVVDDGPHHEGGDGATDAAPVVVQGLLGLSVQQVCCGGQHAAVLTDCGEIFTWGRGGFGRLGHGNTEGTNVPQRIETLQGIPCIQVACGFAYTAAVTASGDLYTWGAGENGRLGLGDVEDRHTPSRVEGLHSKVREVYAGSVHSCVLTREGTVYSFGKHEYTGHGDDEDVLEPRLIPAFSGGSEALVRQISVGPGGYHTMALTCQGQVYAWGHNRVAQLGIGNSFTVPRNIEGAYFLPNPQLVESLLGKNIVKVVAGWGHSAALTKDGQLFVCGRNFQGQLGLGSPQRFPQNERGHPFQAAFCLIDRLSHLKIRQIACGGEHSVAVADNGEVWSFGAGQKGQLGHESTTKEDYPRLVQALKRTRREILHVACGNNCTLVLAGGVAFPSLFERAAAVIRSNPKLCADVDSLGLLPPSVVDSLNRTVDG